MRLIPVHKVHTQKQFMSISLAKVITHLINMELNEVSYAPVTYGVNVQLKYTEETLWTEKCWS
jgi:hypothetical protein